MAHEILIVDDEPDIRALIDGILTDEGYETRQAHNSDSALAAFRARRPGLVVLDIWLQNSKLDGLGILEALHREEPQVPVIMISGHGTIEMAVRAIQIGAYDFIEKPFNADRLLLVMSRALEAARLRQENSELRLRAGPEAELVGGSAGINQLRNAIERVAPTGSRVLISGPAGAGKEVAARMIHARSRRAEGPFVALNCATLNPAGSRKNSSGWRRGLTRWVSRAAPACWSVRMAARCCWTKSPTCRLRRRARSSERCRSRGSSASAARRALKLMCGSSPRPIVTFRRKSKVDGSARISSTASLSCR